jgi:hypothetical protein
MVRADVVAKLGLRTKLIKLARRSEIEHCLCCGAVIPNLAGIELSPLQKMIYFFIAWNPECTMQQIVDHVYASHADGGPIDATGSISTSICIANKRLKNQRIICRFAQSASTYRLVKIEEENAPT